MEFLKVCAVGAWFVIKSVNPGARHEFYEIFVSVVVLGEHNQVVARGIAVFLYLVFLLVVRHIHFAPENRLESQNAVLIFYIVLNFFFAFFVSFLEFFLKFCEILLCVSFYFRYVVGKFFYSHHVSVIGDGHAPHAVGNGFVYDVGNL